MTTDKKKPNLKFYLAHPFETRQKTRVWEEKVERKYGIELVNPFYDLDREDINAIDSGCKEKYAMTDVEKAILVRRDLEEIRKADGVVAVIDGSVSYGTIMEIVYGGIVFGKPVFIICTNGHSQHPWLQVHGTKVFASFKEFERALKEFKRVGLAK